MFSSSLTIGLPTQFRWRYSKSSNGINDNRRKKRVLIRLGSLTPMKKESFSRAACCLLSDSFTHMPRCDQDSEPQTLQLHPKLSPTIATPLLGSRVAALLNYWFHTSFSLTNPSSQKSPAKLVERARMWGISNKESVSKRVNLAKGELAENKFIKFCKAIGSCESSLWSLMRKGNQ